MLQCTHVGKSRKNAPCQWLQRNCSGSAPCRICCLSWSTAFPSHTKGFTHIKQSCCLQCESYLRGVRFGLQNWESFIRHLHRQFASTPILKACICIHITREATSFLVAFIHWWHISPVFAMQAQKKLISCNLAALLQVYFTCWGTEHLRFLFAAPMICTS